jgi:hypothetical protein
MAGLIRRLIGMCMKEFMNPIGNVFVTAEHPKPSIFVQSMQRWANKKKMVGAAHPTELE